MHFTPGHLYHIYNQGNNRRPIFLEERNYLFFLEKAKACFLPYCHVLAWCLMSNHFHFMVVVNRVEVEVEVGASQRMTLSHPLTAKKRCLNDAVAIMLRSYTRAINKKENFSGSLFRSKTKALCLSCPGEIAPAFYQTKAGAQMNRDTPNLSYPQKCFDYIHNNPVKAGLVKHDVDWKYSSARDYYAGRAGKLVNKKEALMYLDW